MPQSTTFNDAITGRNVIAGSSIGPGATMNNYFGPVTQGRFTTERNLHPYPC